MNFNITSRNKHFVKRSKYKKENNTKQCRRRSEFHKHTDTVWHKFKVPTAANWKGVCL